MCGCSVEEESANLFLLKIALQKARTRTVSVFLKGYLFGRKEKVEFMARARLNEIERVYIVVDDLSVDSIILIGSVSVSTQLIATSTRNLFDISLGDRRFYRSKNNFSLSGALNSTCHFRSSHDLLSITPLAPVYATERVNTFLCLPYRHPPPRAEHPTSLRCYLPR